MSDTPVASQAANDQLPPPASQQPEASGQLAKKRSWTNFLNAGAVVAALALIFTFVTFAVERQSQKAQDERDARITLTGIISDLAALPRVYYPLRPEAGGGGAGEPLADPELELFNMQASETAALITLAESIMVDFPNIANPVDYATIGAAQASRLDLRAAINSYVTADEMAIERADSSTVLIARRSIGTLHFALGDIAAGRDAFEQALDWGDIEGADQSLRTYHDLDTRMMWAIQEAGKGQCEAATTQLTLIGEDQAMADLMSVTYEHELRLIDETCGM